MPDRSIKVLIVDDEASLREPLAGWLADAYGYAVQTAGSRDEALDLLAAGDCFDVVLLDYLLPPPHTGISLMKEIQRGCPEAPVDFIIFTGWGLDPRVGVEALRAGAYRYLAKPFDREELAILIQSIVEIRETRERLERTAREKAWLESLLEVSRSVSSTLELDDVLQRILDAMRRFVAYDSTSIQRMTEAGLQVIACRGFPNPVQFVGYVFPGGHDLPNYRVLESGQPLIVEDIQASQPSRHVRGWLGVPLIYRGQAVGVITLDSRQPGFYDEEDARVATIFASQAAVAMENAHLFSEMERRLNELDKLHRASGIMTSKLDLDQVLEEVVALAAEVAGADNTSLVLVEDGGALTQSVEQCSGAFQGIPPLHQRARPEGTTRQVIASGEPLVFQKVDGGGEHNPYLLQAGVASYAGLPLKTKERVVGVLFVHSLAPCTFEDRIPLLMTFANQAAIAIENVRLLQHAQERAEALRRLIEIGQQITQVTDRPKGVLETISRMACRVTGADCAIIYPYLFGQGVYDKTNVASFGLRRAFTPSAKLREYGKSVTARIIQEPAGTWIVPDVGGEATGGTGDKTLGDSPFIRREGIQAFAGVRLDFGVEPVGVLFVNFRSPHHFRQDEIEAVQLFANLAAVAISNARLYGRTSEKLEQKVAELRSVSEINQMITSTLDLEEVLSLILDKARELLCVENGSLQLMDQEGTELSVRLRRGTPVVPEEKVKLKPGQGITGYAAKLKQPALVNDVTQPPWRDIYCEFWPGTRSELAVPLMIGERCIGVLNLEHPEAGFFSEDQREIIERLASQAAIAIRNAQQYEALIDTQEQLIAAEALAWMGMTGSNWAHSVAQKTSSIRNYLAALALYLPDDAKPRDILAKADQVAVAIQSIPITADLPGGPGAAGPLLIDPALQDEVKKYAHAHASVQIEFDLGCPGVKVAITRGWLGVAMEKLVNNALKAMPDGGQLRVASRLREGQVEIDLLDTGRGIPEAHQPHFLKRRVPKAEGEDGSGMGAYMAHTIFRRYGGNLELLWTEAGRGTAVRITLPLAGEMKEHRA
jgi:GAF domain-containing protein/CheY-like chemotaxis protein